MIKLVKLLKTRLVEFKKEHDDELCDGFDLLIKKAYGNYINGNPAEVIRMLHEHCFWLLAKGIITKKDLLENTTQKQRKLFRCFIDCAEFTVNHEIVTVIDSHVRATGNSLVYAFGTSHVTAFDTCCINLYDQSYGKIKDCMGNAFQDSTMLVTGYGYGMYFDNSNGNASGESMVIVSDKANVSSTIGVHFVDKR